MKKPKTAERPKPPRRDCKQAKTWQLCYEAMARWNEAAADTLEDEEVVGLDLDGCVLQWNAETRMSENTGERLEQYGIRNLREHEAPRVGVPEGLRSAICKVFFDCAGAS